MKGFLVYEESSGKSSPERSTSSISCGYVLTLCVYIMPMFMI